MTATVSKLPSPPARDSHVSESHHIVRERQFSPATPLDEIRRTLHDSRATGTLSIDFSDGGIGTIRFSERKKISFDDK